MVDASFLSLLRSPGPPLYVVMLIVIVMAWKIYPLVLARINERRRDAAGEKAGDWSRLRAEIKRLDARCDHLQREVDECREREGDWMQRAIAAESALMGKGEVKQEAQRIVSTEREIDAGKRRAKDA